MPKVEIKPNYYILFAGIQTILPTFISDILIEKKFAIIKSETSGELEWTELGLLELKK